MLIDDMKTIVVGLGAVLFYLSLVVFGLSVVPYLTVQSINCIAGKEVFTFGISQWASWVWLLSVCVVVFGGRRKR